MNSSLRDFNIYVEKLMCIKSEENEVNLTRSLSILCLENFDLFNTNCEENGQFFINLYKILSTVDKNSDALWTIIEIIHKLSKNINARNAIMDKYKFFPLLANILESAIVQENIKKLLLLIQDLSYGIKITWEEPYLDKLIKKLLNEINNGEDESLSYISLSILINICYNNFPVRCLLLRYIKPSNFFQQIKSFRILAHKMIIILDDNLNINDLNYYIKMSFTEIVNAIQNRNIPYLKHICDFLINSKDFIQLHQALTEYEYFENDINDLLQAIGNIMKMNNSNNNTDEYEKNFYNCLSLIYEFLNYILDLTTNTKSEKHLLKNVLNQIYIFLYNGILSKYADERALNLFETIVKIANEDLIEQISKDLTILQQFIENIELNNSNKYTTGLQKLLISLLKNEKTQKIILSIVKESFFDKIFFKLLEIKPDNLEISIFTIDDLSKYLYCLLVLNEFLNISKNAWIDKVSTIFTLKQIQFILAMGMLSKNELLCNIVFEISKIDCFPYSKVAKVISNLSTFSLPHQKIVKFNSSNLCNCSLNTNNHSLNVSNSCEERVNAVTEKLFNDCQKSQFTPATSELIEIFNYKINMLNTKMENFSKRLVNACEEKTQLYHEISLNNIELTKYHGLNYKMQIRYESLQNQIKDLEKQRNLSKSGIEEMSQKYKEERLKYKNHSKNLEIKIAELKELRQELYQMKLQHEKQINEIQTLKSISDDNTKRITQLKLTLSLTEKNLCEKEKIIENQEKEIQNLTKSNEEHRESEIKNSKLINHLQGQIAEKNEQIRSIESELSETEEMRKTILSIMESKKPKRKN